MSSTSEITIKLSDGSKITLTKYQALEFYNELDHYFGGIDHKFYPTYQPYPIYPYDYPVFPNYTTNADVIPFVRDNTG